MPLPFMTVRDLFEGLSEPEIRRIEGFCTEKRYRPDDVLFCRGDDARALFIVRRGLVKLVAVSESGAETILHILRAGDVFGEPIACEGRRPFTAVALTDAAATVLPREKFLALLSGIPAFSRAVLSTYAKRLLQVENGFADLLHAWAWHRLAKELLHLAADLGTEGPDGTLIPLHLTHEELSNLIGTSRETVTLQLRRFEEMGMIRRRGRHIVVNRPRMSEYVHVGE